jgi:hypothetical protein
VRADVDEALQEPEMLHARVSAIRADGTFIRDCLAEIDASILESIDPAENLRPDHATQRLIARVSAAVINVARGEGGDDAVFVESDTRVAEGALVAMGA